MAGSVKGDLGPTGSGLIAALAGRTTARGGGPLSVNQAQMFDLANRRRRTRRASRSSQRIVPGGRLNSWMSCRTALRTALSMSD